MCRRKNRSQATIGKLIILAMTFVIAACGGDSTTDIEHVAKAKVFIDKSDSKAAFIELKNAIQKNGQNAEARLMLGELYLDTGNGLSAEKELNKAQELGVPKKELIFSLASAYLFQNDFKKISDMAIDESYSGELKAKLYLTKGDSELAQSKFDNACGFYEKAISQDKKYINAYLGMARCTASNDLDKAEKILDQALAIDEKNAAIYSVFGDFYNVRGEADKAREFYNKALALDDKNYAAYFGLVPMYIASKQLEKADAAVTKLQKISPNNFNTQYMKAYVQFSKNELDSANETLLKILKIIPDHARSNILYGIVSFKKGAYEQADKAFAVFLNQNSGNIEVRLLRAELQLTFKQYDGVLGLLQPLLQNNVKELRVYTLAGDAYYQLGNYNKAIELYKTASKMNPEDSSIKTGIAYAQVARGEMASAISILQDLSTDDKKEKRADILLVNIYLEKNDIPQALAKTDALLTKYPDSADIYDLRGSIFLKKKDIDSAIKSFENAISKDPEYVPSLKNLAELDVKNGDLKKATARFDNLLEKHPDNYRAQLYTANLALLSGDKATFISKLTKITESSAKMAEPFVLLAKYHLQEGSPQKALSFAHQAENLNSNAVDVIEVLGLSQFATGELANAQASFEKMKKLAPDNPKVYEHLAKIYLKQDNITIAKKVLDQGLTVAPKDKDLILLTIRINSETGNLAVATKLARDLLKQEPDSTAIEYIYAQLMEAQKNYKDAYGGYQKVFKGSPNSEVLIRLHRMMVVLGEPGADNVVSSWLEKNPKDVGVLMYMGGSYLSRGKTQYAIEQYTKITEIAPDNYIAYNNLANLYQETDIKKAMMFAEKAYKLQPDNAATMDTLGSLQLDIGETEKGLRLLESAFNKAPGVYSIKLHFARGLLKTGKKDQGIKYLKELSGVKANVPEKAQAKKLLESTEAQG